MFQNCYGGGINNHTQSLTFEFFFLNLRTLASIATATYLVIWLYEHYPSLSRLGLNLVFFS